MPRRMGDIPIAVELASVFDGSRSGDEESKDTIGGKT
jgi:hypothetical protein